MFPHNTKENLADRIPPACPRNSGAPYLLFKSSYKSFIHQAASPIISLFQANIIFLLEILRFFHLCFCSTKKKKVGPAALARILLVRMCTHAHTHTHTTTHTKSSPQLPTLHLPISVGKNAKMPWRSSRAAHKQWRNPPACLLCASLY